MRRFALLAAFLFFLAPAAQAAPQVVVSIYPIHSLVAGVMAGVGEPLLLVRGAATPHDYALKPSDAKALANADVVFWIGPELETFLVKPLATVKKGASVVALAQAPGIALKENREGGTWEAHDHGHSKDAKYDDDETDMHVWLDPVNAQTMTAMIAETLAAKDPANANAYRANGTKVNARLAALNTSLATKLKPVAGVPYVVFHDAYQYFDTRYGLNAIGSVTVSPERPPSAARLRAIRAKIVSLKARCVFGEPQVKPSVVAAVMEGLDVNTAILDPLEQGPNPGPDAYFTGMERLADAHVACLSR
ncbi:MAG: zinc ABC transporter substrate-binding protein [Alphaproteobacteria bacterium]